MSRSSGDSNPCEVINYLRDDDVRHSTLPLLHSVGRLSADTASRQEEASACCCAWIRDPVTGDPYICIGGVDAKVKVYDVRQGKEVEVRRAPD